MTEQTRKVLHEALELPRPERAAVVEALLASLDPSDEGPADVEAAWAVEIERRLQAHLDGKGRSIPWTQVRAEADELLRGQ